MLITPLTHILVKRLQKHFKYGPMSIAFNGFKKILTVWFTGLLVVFTSSCITDYQGTIGGSSEVLVVNGLLTDEYKKQLVQLSRSYTFENAGPRYETDAAVSVSGSDGSLYSFYETPNGVYKSIAAFAAKAGSHANSSTQGGSNHQCPGQSWNIYSVGRERPGHRISIQI